MSLGNKIEIKNSVGKTLLINLYNIFYIKIINRDKREIYLSNPYNNSICIEDFGRMNNTQIVVEKFGTNHFIQTHQKYIIPKFRAIGHDAKWKFMSIKTTVTSYTQRYSEMFRTEELPIGTAYRKKVKEFFFDDSRVMFRNKPKKEKNEKNKEEPDYVYVFIDAITHIVSNNELYKRSIYLNSPINFGNNCYLIEEHSNKPLNTYLDRLVVFPIHFRVHQSFIVNFASVISRDKYWKHLIIKTFDNKLKKATKTRIPIGRSYKNAVIKLFENIAIDE